MRAVFTSSSANFVNRRQQIERMLKCRIWHAMELQKKRADVGDIAFAWEVVEELSTILHDMHEKELEQVAEAHARKLDTERAEALEVREYDV